MANDAAKAASALSILTKNGTTYTIQRETATSNPAQPWKPNTIDTTSQTAYGILDDFSDGMRNGETIQNSDRKYTIAASNLTFVPDAGDLFIDKTQTHRIISVSAVRSAAVDVIYNVHVRS